jgi:diguanylate cyclase (GGDEF)-like protein/PAS domain S-box-containing protein
LCALPVFAAPEKPRPKKILLLLSDPAQINQYVNALDSAIRARVSGDVLFLQADVGVDELELTTQYSNSFAEAYRSRFEHAQLDLVIAVGRGAFVFLTQYHEKVFPGVPILFTGVGTKRFGGKTWPGMTGLTVPVPMAETVDLALQLQPKTETIALVADPADSIWAKAARTEIARYRDRVKEVDIIEPAGPAALNKVNALPPRTVVLFALTALPASGMPRLEGYDLIDAIAQRAPTYSPWHTLCENHGCVGGAYDDDDKAFAWVTETAVRILSGERPENIPIKNSTDVRVTVDWRELKRWGISETKLPPGSIILHRPPSPWELYKWYILGGLSLIALETLLIFGLLINRARARRAEAELSHNQRRLAGLVETALDAIIAVDEEQRIVLFNAAAERIFGCPTASAIGSSLDRFIPQRSRAVHSAHIRRFGETGTTNRVMGALDTLSGLRSTGEEFPIEASISQVETSGKKLYTVILRDITERKIAAQRILERDGKLREAEEIAHLGHSAWDAESNSTTWSEGLYKITGWDPHQPPPSHSDRAKLYAPESWERLDAAVKHSLATGDPYNLELQIVRCDGALRWVRARGFAGRDHSGKVNRLFGTLQDITEQKLSEVNLRDSEERFRATFEQAAVGILHVSFGGQILRCNKRFAEFLGYSPEEIAGKSFQQFTPPEYISESKEYLDEFRAGNIDEQVFEKQYIHKNGSILWGRLRASVQRNGKGEPLHLVTFVEDITARKSAEEHLAAASKELQASEVRHRTVFQTSLNALSVSRLSDGMLVDVNKTFLDLTGFQREEVIGKTAVELGIWVNESERQEVFDELRRDSSVSDVELLFRRKDGNTFWGLTSASVIEFDGVPHVLVATRDLSEVKDAVKMIRELAFYDPLTHLPNRRSLLDLLEKANDTDPRVRALLFVDLDHFKLLNDALGHRTGDLLLQEAAQRLAACVRGEGAVARVGGDEFAIVLENPGDTTEQAAKQAKQLGERILTAVALPYLVGERECHFSVSIGITIFGTDLKSGIEALQQGEIAITKAKEAGRNTLRFFSPELQANVNARVHLENELRQAINAKEFELYFQLQVRAGRLIGSEALIRWNHPRRGLLAPGAFIELAEDTGLILPMGNWALWTACVHVAAWAGKNPSGDAPVAVNISEKQFSQPDFVARVLATLKLTGANPASIKLELTETSLVKDFQDAVAKMTELKSHGLRFSVDDFGTGYSSLAYLKNLPLDQLKIDRAFVKDILVDGPSGAIAQAIIAMGHSMGFSVIAEGVETELQRDFLIGIGCDCFQGFLYSRPVPAEDFERAWFL